MLFFYLTNSKYVLYDIITGAEHTDMQKRRNFKSIASLEPVVLEKRIASSEVEEDKPHNNNHSTKQLQNIEETNARDLLNFFKRSIPSNSLMNKAENLLFDYFKQSIGENNNVGHSKKLHLCNVAEDWIRGKPREQYLGWEVKDGRRVYISEMDKCGEWQNSDQATQELALEMQNEIFTSLVNELVLELATS